MSVYLLLPLVQFVSSLALAIIVIRNRFHYPTNRLFFYFLLCVALWGLIIFGMRSSPGVQQAYVWEKGLIPLSPLLPILFYHFSVRYTGTRINQRFLTILYVFCFLFSALAFTDLVVKGMQIKNYGYAPILGPIAPVWFLSTYVIYAFGLTNFLKARKASRSPEQRNRYTYIIAGIIITFIGGALDILPAFGLPLYPGLILGTLVFILLTSIAIVKYRLLDINRIIRIGIAYLSTSVVITVPFIAILLIMQNLLNKQNLSFEINITILVLLVLLLPQIWQYVQRNVDRLFYRERHNYLKALGEFNRGTQYISDNSSLYSKIVGLIADVLHIRDVYLFRVERQGSDFNLVSTTNKVIPLKSVSFDTRSALVKWLERSDSIIYGTDIEIIPQLQSVSSDDKAVIRRTGVEVIVPLKSSDGRVIGMLLLGQKLSGKFYSVEDEQLLYTLSGQLAVKLENIRLYEEAIQSREALETWLDTMSDCVLIIDAQGRIQFSNKSATDKLGARKGQIWREARKVKNVPMNILPHQDRDGNGGLSYYMIVGQKEYDVAVAQLVNPDGTKSIIEVFRDVTEQKKLVEKEKVLQQELHLASRLASIGQLAAGVAHELNNPLTGILGFSERLLRKTGDETVSRDLNRIHNEALRAARVVENLRVFARSWKPNKELSSVNDILTKALELRAYELEKSNIKVNLDLDTNTPLVLVDFYQMQQVFLNIIVNAEQAMNQANNEGNLEIKTERAGSYINITFSDNGPGIPPGYIDKIFDPFFTTRDKEGGTGLGLSICHGIVTGHGGKIYVRNQRIKGATFVIELPLNAS